MTWLIVAFVAGVLVGAAAMFWWLATAEIGPFK